MAKSATAGLSSEALTKMYLQMCEIRYFEEQVQYVFLTEDMPGSVHSSMGQEAIAVGAVGCLRKDDYLYGSHRGHGQYIVKGGTAREVMAEIFGKDTGCSRGMGGSIHLSNLDIGYLPGVGVVGATIPIGSGAALSAKMRGTDQVALTVFGDGAANSGYFHEGMNLAAIWKLPVVFLCENNFYAVSVCIRDAMVPETIASRASAYGFEGVVVDGNDVLAVYEATQAAVQKAREGGGPTLLECQTYRHKGHSRFEPGTSYRPEEEVEAWMARDPIPLFKSKLLEMNIVSEEQIEDIEKEARAIVDDAVAFSKESPEPDADVGLKYVFA